MWTLHKQQQHRGAQLHARSGGTRQAGEAPADATRDRAAQEHDKAGDGTLPAGAYPASPIEHGEGDPATGLRTGERPAAPRGGEAEWDKVVQPEHGRDDQPLPEGK
jgi:hypothetical protein